MRTDVTISVVFTDLVGSTALGSRLGPQKTEEVRQQHFAVLRSALAATGGTEVKNLGDGLMVVYPSLGRALDGAVAMQQGIGRHNARGEEELAIRVGVSTGDAVQEDGDYFGEPVVEAARLCAKAEGGQILTSEMVRILQKRTDHVFRSVGTLELKGLPEPIDAYEVGWEPSGTPSAMPMPARLSDEPLVALCGRHAERERLLQLLKDARAGSRRLALLAGEPGVGKTRLASEVARAAHDEGAIVLYGRSDEDVAVSYQPFVESLGQLVENAPDDLLARHVDSFGGELATLVPSLRRRVPGVAEPQRSDPETERYLLFGAVAGLLADASATTCVVLVLDDLHWADKQTIVLLRHLVQSASPMALLVIGTYRDTDLADGDPMVDLLADLRREMSVERLSLEGLGDDEVVSFLEGMAGHDLDGDAVTLAHLVRRETAGNPFFIGEMMRHLAESRQIVVGEDGRWRAAQGITPENIGLPESVRETVGRRIRRLSVAAGRALSVAAVVGREFDLATLAEVDETTEDELLDVLEGAQRAALIDEMPDVPGRFRFSSALIQQTIYDDLSVTRRARMHRRIGVALEVQLGGDPGDRVGELARHWTMAVQPTDLDKAIAYARRAGERALDKLAPHDAVRWFGTALDLERQRTAATDTDRVDILVWLGKAQRQAGLPGFRTTLLEAGRMARECGDHDRLVQAALANNRGNFSSAGRVDADRIEMLEAALAVMDDRDTPERARVLAMLALESIYAGDYERRRALSDEAVQIARRLGDAATLAQVLTFRHETIRVPQTRSERADFMAEARSKAAAADDPWLEYWATSFSAHPALETGDGAGVERFHDAARTIAATLGQPILAWHATYHDSWGALLRGRAEEAEELATLALSRAEEAGEPDAFAIYGTQILCVRWHQGRLGELVDLLHNAAVDNPGIPAYRAAHARALFEGGSVDAAREQVDAALERRFADHQLDNLWLAGVTIWGEIAADIAHEAAAAELYRQLRDATGQVASTGASVFGPVDYALGGLQRTLGNLDAAVAHFEQADALARGLDAPFFVARTAVELARTLRARGGAGDTARADALLTEAVELSEVHGCTWVAKRAHELLAAAT